MQKMKRGVEPQTSRLRIYAAHILSSLTIAALVAAAATLLGHGSNSLLILLFSPFLGLASASFKIWHLKSQSDET